MKNKTISLRISDGWRSKMPNKSKYSCDYCGAHLWTAPHGGSYCDSENENHEAK